MSIIHFQPNILESSWEYYQDFMLGVFYLIIAIFSVIRTTSYFDPFGAGRVITTFYLQIVLTSILRAIYFFIPKFTLGISYIPTALNAFQSPGWLSSFLCEILLTLGSISLYSVFILVIAYWAYNLRKVDPEPIEPEPRTKSRSRLSITPRKGAIKIFLTVVGYIFIIEIINYALFLIQVFNSEEMIVFDSILLSILSVASLVSLTLYSRRIRLVLSIDRSDSIINSYSKAQIWRILILTIVANLFFLCRVAVEMAFSISVIKLMYENKSLNVLLTQKYWDLYVLIKHSSELMVLTLGLAISTNISAPKYNLQSSDITIKDSKNAKHKHSRHSKITELTPLMKTNNNNYNSNDSSNLLNQDKLNDLAVNNVIIRL